MTDRPPELPGCERCGASEAVEVGQQFLCESCYATAGSCCPGWGEEDCGKSDAPIGS